ncbi:hypothetical protein H5410_023156 [Solanum commersonii]|uniref:Uncharacterized protein n=1 Tax=Solanum commersonii TaxID=4109 RepID=A0A9J5ZG23_SOLCO|nr:hypothetical protein H5410_023156 [Solanum commersonii]
MVVLSTATYQVEELPKVSYTLTKWSFVNMSRDFVYYWLSIMICLMVSVCIGIIYINAGTNILPSRQDVHLQLHIWIFDIHVDWRFPSIHGVYESFDLTPSMVAETLLSELSKYSVPIVRCTKANADSESLFFNYRPQQRWR